MLLDQMAQVRKSLLRIKDKLINRNSSSNQQRLNNYSKISKPFKTSYRTKFASLETSRAICLSPELAIRDLEFQTYNLTKSTQTILVKISSLNLISSNPIDQITKSQQYRPEKLTSLPQMKQAQTSPIKACRLTTLKEIL